MTTKQNDTAALTDEQLDGIAGGIMPLPSPGPERLPIVDPIYFPRRVARLVQPSVGRARIDVGRVFRRR